MNIIDKIGQTLGLGDYDEKIIEPKENETPKNEQPIEKEEIPESEGVPKKVLSFNSAASFNRENSSSSLISYKNNSEIKTIKPKNLTDARTISDLLRDKIAVVLNLEETEPAEAQRILDFICGTTYAVDGKLKPISKKVFICAPDNVKVESYEDEKKSKNTFLD